MRTSRIPAALLGLREHEKHERRRTIVDVGVRLFHERGYAETTLVDVADAAGVAPRTLANYFRTKRDIAMAVTDDVIESARERILERRPDEPASEALLGWVTDGDLARVVHNYAGALQVLPQIIIAVPALRAAVRVRQGLLENTLAAAYARDFAEPPDSIRARVMAVIALRGMFEVWESWYRRHALDPGFDPRVMLGLQAAYLKPALAAGLQAVATLPPAATLV
jgi:AcrR family transcriptional regulator